MFFFETVDIILPARHKTLWPTKFKVKGTGKLRNLHYKSFSATLTKVKQHQKITHCQWKHTNVTTQSKNHITDNSFDRFLIYAKQTKYTMANNHEF